MFLPEAPRYIQQLPPTRVYSNELFDTRSHYVSVYIPISLHTLQLPSTHRHILPLCNIYHDGDEFIKYMTIFEPMKTSSVGTFGCTLARVHEISTIKASYLLTKFIYNGRSSWLGHMWLFFIHSDLIELTVVRRLELGIDHELVVSLKIIECCQK